MASGGVFDTCSPSNGGTEDYVLIATLICGSTPADAGSDGGIDAGADAAGD
jgi:hypothetical protein